MLIRMPKWDNDIRIWCRGHRQMPIEESKPPHSSCTKLSDIFSLVHCAGLASSMRSLADPFPMMKIHHGLIHKHQKLFLSAHTMGPSIGHQNHSRQLISIQWDNSA